MCYTYIEVIILKTGMRIKYFRQLRGLSRENLAKELNLTKFAIAKYEQDQRSPELNTLKKISEILNIPFSVLSGSILNEFAIQLDKSIKFQHETLETLSEQLSISLQDIQNVYNGFLDKVSFEVLNKIAVYYNKNINELLYWSSDFFILNDINKREKIENFNETLSEKLPKKEKSNMDEQCNDEISTVKSIEDMLSYSERNLSIEAFKTILQNNDETLSKKIDEVSSEEFEELRKNIADYIKYQLSKLDDK